MSEPKQVQVPDNYPSLAALLPRSLIDEYLQTAGVSKKGSRIMFIDTTTSHSLHLGVAIDWNAEKGFIRMRTVLGPEVTVALIPGTYVGLTNTVAKFAP